MCFFVGYISVKKDIKNWNSLGTRAHKVEKIVSVLPNFDPHFIKFGKCEEINISIKNRSS